MLFLQKRNYSAQRCIRWVVGIYLCRSTRGGEKPGQDSTLERSVYLCCGSCDRCAPSHNRKLGERSAARSQRDSRFPLRIVANGRMSTRDKIVFYSKNVFFLIVGWNSGGGAKCTAHKDNVSLLQVGNCISHHALGSKLNFAQSRSARAMRWVSTSVSARILTKEKTGERASPSCRGRDSFSCSHHKASDWEIQSVKLPRVSEKTFLIVQTETKHWWQHVSSV